MHDALPQPGGFIRPGVMSGRMHGEIRKLTGVPGANPLSLQRSVGEHFVIDIETVAGRAEIGADTTS